MTCTAPYVALGKVAGLWHAVGEGEPPVLVKIGHGRRRTFTETQLAAARRFETDLLARRAGRAAGFPKTFAHLIQ